MLESEPKDSGAAIGLAAAILHERDPDTIMGSFAADQVISPDGLFQDAVREAIHTAAAGKIVTIGIKPTAPLHRVRLHPGRRRTSAWPGPPAPRPSSSSWRSPAKKSPRSTWTAANTSGTPGMFVAPVSLMLKHLEANQPELFAGLQEIAKAWDTPQRDEVTARVWPTLPKIAIDYAVAEPAAAAGDVAVVPGTSGWDDVGDFASVGRLNSAKEVKDVTVIGEGARVFTENASGVVVSDTKRVIALIGIKDVVIVDTPDALLVTTKEHSQRVKQAVDALKASGDTDVL